jgi:uncharacterized MAPEG superfamily protein
MTTDLWMLVYSALLCVSIPLLGVTKLLAMPGGPQWGFGNRDDSFVVPDWVNRTRRAHMNMVENLAPFACLVLAAHVSGNANETTALGAQIFFVARVAHAAIYIIGIPYARTAVFGLSFVGMFMILGELF